MATLKTKIQVRRDTYDNLKSVVLNTGEPGYATDTGHFVMGDGTSTFETLVKNSKQHIYYLVGDTGTAAGT